MPMRAYGHGKGWLLGHSFLLFTHLGRKTGRRYQTVAMVLSYRPETQEAVICSAWGSDSDWITNITARPAIQVEIGRDVFTPQQRFLSEGESVAVIEQCMHVSWPSSWAGEIFGSDLWRAL
jgi:deazaflavin-dependent oxidoreductase (nitroreductase family)